MIGEIETKCSNPRQTKELEAVQNYYTNKKIEEHILLERHDELIAYLRRVHPEDFI